MKHWKVTTQQIVDLIGSIVEPEQRFHVTTCTNCHRSSEEMIEIKLPEDHEIIRKIEQQFLEDEQCSPDNIKPRKTNGSTA